MDIDKAIEKLHRHATTPIPLSWQEAKWIIQIIQALREKQERDKGCEYCTDLGRHKVISAEISHFKAADDIYNFPMPVKYCPNCGRMLKENEASE